MVEMVTFLGPRFLRLREEVTVTERNLELKCVKYRLIVEANWFTKSHLAGWLFSFLSFFFIGFICIIRGRE